MRTPRYGRMTPAEGARMAASLPQYRDVIALLTDTPASRARILAATAAADAEAALDGEDFSHLWPPKSRAEAERRVMLAASARAALDDDDTNYAAIFGEDGT